MFLQYGSLKVSIYRSWLVKERELLFLNNIKGAYQSRNVCTFAT